MDGCFQRHLPLQIAGSGMNEWGYLFAMQKKYKNGRMLWLDGNVKCKVILFEVAVVVVVDAGCGPQFWNVYSLASDNSDSSYSSMNGPKLVANGHMH